MLRTVFSALAFAALMSASALAADAAALAGNWVFTQSDGHGGAGCPMVLGTEQTDDGALSASFDRDPSDCFEVLAGVTGWTLEGDTITLYRGGAAAIALADTGNPDAVIYEDAKKTYYMERLGDAD